jgi:hypothetical protein
VSPRRDRRQGNVTHGFDYGQLLIELPFAAADTQTLVATVPNNLNSAPPGYYLLFVVDDLRIPSAGSWVQVTSKQAASPSICTDDENGFSWIAVNRDGRLVATLSRGARARGGRRFLRADPAPGETVKRPPLVVDNTRRLRGPPDRL